MTARRESTACLTDLLYAVCLYFPTLPALTLSWFQPAAACLTCLTVCCLPLLPHPSCLDPVLVPACCCLSLSPVSTVCVSCLSHLLTCLYCLYFVSVSHVCTVFPACLTCLYCVFPACLTCLCCVSCLSHLLVLSVFPVCLTCLYCLCFLLFCLLLQSVFPAVFPAYLLVLSVFPV